MDRAGSGPFSVARYGFGDIKSRIKQYFSGDKTENWMGGTCSIYGGEERRIQGFGGEP